MLTDEKVRLLAFFESDGCWCQDAEARDAYGRPVKFHDPLAAAWDITGALCRLFGWRRACALFGQLERHVRKRRRVPGDDRDSVIESMVNLQAYNDRPEMEFGVVLKLLETMPVWTGVSRPTNASAQPVGSRDGGGSPTQRNTEAC